MKVFLVSVFASMVVLRFATAHEAVGRAGFKEPAGVEVETEFYAGKEGYIHGGLGAIAPLDEKQKVGIMGHFVREESGGDVFPSLGAEYIRDMGGGVELEAFSFGYLPVEKQSAWAAGLRGSRRYSLSDDVSLTPFLGPAYARVRALDEETGTPVGISHLMLLGGMAVEAGPVELTVFGSHSFFSRAPSGLETHVDLEEMTHFGAYENNDGFARNTVGAELSWSPTASLNFSARYALILYQDETRHSMSVTPGVKIGERLEVFAGVQFLWGDGPDNNLLMTGVAFSF
jgi:hypothetical protein